MILFLAFVVIFVTLVVQGLSLPWLIRVLNIKPEMRRQRTEKLSCILYNNTMHYIDRELSVKLNDDAKPHLKTNTIHVQTNSQRDPDPRKE